MLRVIVLLAFILHVSVAMADEPLEIRSRLFNLQEVEGMVTGTMLVEVTNRGPDLLEQVVLRAEDPIKDLFRIGEIGIAQISPGTTKPVRIPLKTREIVLKMAESTELSWDYEYVSARDERRNYITRDLHWRFFKTSEGDNK